MKHSCVLNKTQLCFKNFSLRQHSLQGPRRHPHLTYKHQSPISGSEAIFARNEWRKRLIICIKKSLPQEKTRCDAKSASHLASHSASRLLRLYSASCKGVTHATQKNKLFVWENIHYLSFRHPSFIPVPHDLWTAFLLALF